MKDDLRLLAYCGLERCGACTEFPCSVISEFVADGVPHHGRRSRISAVSAT